MGFDLDIDDSEIVALRMALQKLPFHLTEEVHIEALKKAAVPLRDRMFALAPKREWDLAEAIKIRKSKFKKLGEHTVVVGPEKKSGGHGYLAHFHEYGTHSKNGAEKIKAKPFMRPADEQTKAEQQAIYEREIQVAIDKRIDGL